MERSDKTAREIYADVKANPTRPQVRFWVKGGTNQR